MPLLSRIPRPIKTRLKSGISEARRAWVRAFRSYDPPQLRAALAALGVEPGDTVMLHGGFGGHHGFRGSIEDLTDTVIELLGPQGTLAMVSLPYRSSSLQYLQTMKRFDVRRTPSMMGLISEYFRHRPGVLRSLHPTHPVLALGARAEWLVRGHEDSVYPCGPDTPFGRLLQADGKIVFFNVEFATFTFFHYLEHHVSPRLPFRLYTDEPFQVPVIDHAGQSRTVSTYVFSPAAIARRRFPVLEEELRRRGMIAQRRVGATRLEAIRLRDAMACVEEMWRNGRYFYDLAGAKECQAGQPH